MPDQGENNATPGKITVDKQTAPDKKKLRSEKKAQNKFESNNQYFTISIYCLFVILIGSLILYAVLHLSNTLNAIGSLLTALSPFIVAIFLSLLLDPLMSRLCYFLNRFFFKDRYQTICKGLSILLTYLLFGTLVITALVYVVPQLISSIQDLTNNIPAMYNSCVRFFVDIEKRHPDLDLQIILDQISALEPKLIEYGTNLMTNAVPFIVNISVSIVRLLINILLSIVISCYLMSDKKNMKKQGKRLISALFPEHNTTFFMETAKECCRIFSSFFVGKAIDSLIIGLLCFICLTILKIPYTVLLSVIVGVTNMIPYFGPFIGAVPGILILLLIDPVDAVIFTITIFILQQFDGLLLGPKILGDSTGLTPLWVIFAITVGGHFFGILGMFLGVPFTAVIAYLLNALITQQLKRKNITNL